MARPLTKRQLDKQRKAAIWSDLARNFETYTTSHPRFKTISYPSVQESPTKIYPDLKDFNMPQYVKQPRYPTANQMKAQKKQITMKKLEPYQTREHIPLDKRVELRENIRVLRLKTQSKSKHSQSQSSKISMAKRLQCAEPPNPLDFLPKFADHCPEYWKQSTPAHQRENSRVRLLQSRKGTRDPYLLNDVEKQSRPDTADPLKSSTGTPMRKLQEVTQKPGQINFYKDMACSSSHSSKFITSRAGDIYPERLGYGNSESEFSVHTSYSRPPSKYSQNKQRPSTAVTRFTAPTRPTSASNPNRLSTRLIGQDIDRKSLAIRSTGFEIT